jgi:hypothetical protein
VRRPRSKHDAANWNTLYAVADRDLLEDVSGWYDAYRRLWWVTVDPRTGIAWTWCES